MTVGWESSRIFFCTSGSLVSGPSVWMNRRFTTKSLLIMKTLILNVFKPLRVWEMYGRASRWQWCGLPDDDDTLWNSTVCCRMLEANSCSITIIQKQNFTAYFSCTLHRNRFRAFFVQFVTYITVNKSIQNLYLPFSIYSPVFGYEKITVIFVQIW